MRCKAGILCVLFIGITSLIYAQNQNEEPSEDIDWDNIQYDAYASGDQALTISLGVVFPALFVYDGVVHPKSNNFDPPVGGTGSFTFNYYLFPYLFVGGEIGGMFLPTLAKNTMYVIYLGGRVGTQFIAWRFEFPISASFGMSWQTYLDEGHYTMYLRGSVAAFFRATPSWAFGLTSSWFFIPQWTGNRATDGYGNFVDLTLSAKYQF